MRFARFAFAVITPAAIASLSAGCSDPVPPTPQGAWRVSFVATDGSKCGIMSHSASVGSVSATDRTTVVPNSSSLVDGGDKATVSCTVSGAGPFYVEGSVELGARSLTVVIPKIDASARESSPVPGSVTYFSETTVTPFSSSSCQFYFEDAPGRIAPGKAWLSFKCPEIVAASKPGTQCGLAESYAIFENCSQTAPDQ